MMRKGNRGMPEDAPTEDPLYQWAMQQLELLDRYHNEPTEQQDDT